MLKQKENFIKTYISSVEFVLIGKCKAQLNKFKQAKLNGKLMTTNIKQKNKNDYRY